MSATTAEPVTEQTTDAPPASETPVEEPFDKERAMATIAKLREQEKRAKQLERELAELKTAEDKAKEDALAEQAQFKQLADKRADKIVELSKQLEQIEPLTQERDQLAAVVGDLVKQQREGLPEHVIELLEGKSAVEQLAWITKHRETLTGRTGGPTTGVPGLPRPVTNVSRDEQIRAEIEAQRTRPRR